MNLLSVLFLVRKGPLGGVVSEGGFAESFAEILRKFCKKAVDLSTSDFQSEVGEVFGEIGGELPAKFGRRFSSFFCWENREKHIPPKLHRKFHHQTSLRGSGLWRALLIAPGKSAEIPKGEKVRSGPGKPNQRKVSS